MANINYTATADLKAYSTWLTNNVDQNASTWDSTTQEGVLVLNSGVTEIGVSAFQNCTALSSITLPSVITSIGNLAFRGSGLITVTLPDSLTTMGWDIFRDCVSLTSIKFPENLTEIPNSTCNGCTALTNVVFPNNLTKIIQYAFYNCPQLTKITLPASIQNIGAYNFQECTNVTCLALTPPHINYQTFLVANDKAYVLPSVLSAYQNNSSWSAAFASIEALVIINYTATADIKAATTWLQNNVNQSASTWDSTTQEGILVLNSGVTTIGSLAFFNLNSLIEIDIPASITSIGSSAFTACPYLTTVTLHEGLTTISSEVFYNCSRLQSITIPATVTSIGNSAFENCTTITELGIPRSITEIEDNAFNGCDNLLFVMCEATIPPTLGTNNFTADNDTLQVPKRALSAYQNDPAWSAAFTTIEAMPESVLYYTATSDIKAFSTWARNNIDQSLSTWDSGTGEGVLYFNEGVTEIGTEAFISCTALTSLDFSDAFTITTIKSGAFRYCSNLTSVVISKYISDIQVSVTNNINPFIDCYSLVSIVVDTENTYYDSRDNCNAIIRTIDNALISGCQTTVIPNTVVTTEYTSFQGQSQLTTLVIPASVTELIRNTTYDCNNLKDVYFLSTTPPTVGQYNFWAYGDTMHVPMSALQTYQSSSIRSYFTYMVGFYTVNTYKSGPGSITPTKYYDANADATVTITPDEGCVIYEVVVDGISVGPVDSYTFTSIDADHTVEAIFKHQYTITASAGINGSISPSGSITITEGSDQTFTITPNAHYRILDVTIDGESVGAVDTYTFESVDTDHTIYATFELITHTITATAFEGGAIVPSDTITVNDGDSQTFDIIPLDEYGILAVFIDGVQIEPVETYTFTDVEADHTIQALFYQLRVAGFNRDEMLDINYILQDYLEQLRKRD